MFKPPPTVILHLQDQFVAQLRVLGRTVDVSVGEIAECVLLLIDTGLLLLQRAQKALKSLNDEQRARLRHGVNFIHETVRERCELFGDPHGTI